MDTEEKRKKEKDFTSNWLAAAAAAAMATDAVTAALPPLTASRSCEKNLAKKTTRRAYSDRSN